jgi:hypothetical protein
MAKRARRRQMTRCQVAEKLPRRLTSIILRGIRSSDDPYSDAAWFACVGGYGSGKSSSYGWTKKVKVDRSMRPGDKQDAQRSEADAELERETRQGRKFSLGDAIGRLAGPGVMKGASPVARMQQAEIEIGTWLRNHLLDAGGSLEIVLHRNVKASELLLNNFDQPLVVLGGYCQRVLDSDYLLEELVRAADTEWGRLMGERPHFEKKGAPLHPDDPYTVESVRNALSKLLKQLAMDTRCKHS